MCEPTTLAVLSIASTAAQVYQQDQNAKVQSQINQQNYDNQMTALRTNYANANLTKQQEAENLAAEKNKNNILAQKDMAKAKVSAGESNITGLSVDSLLQELGSSAGTANTNAEINYLRRDRAIEADKANAWSGAATQIGNLKTPQGADYLGAAVKIGTTYSDARAKGAFS
jgi:hypothetical protein